MSTFAKMNNVIEHIEYLVRRHDCVVIPSWGAFIAHHQAARFDDAASLYMPPVRQISFNVNVDYDDGLLTASIARKLGITFSKAAKIVAQEVDAMKCQLDADGEISLGSVGRFIAQEGSTPLFEPSTEIKRFESMGLMPVEAKPIIEQTLEEEAPAQKPAPTLPRRIGLRALKIAAAIAVTISVGAAMVVPSLTNRNDNLAGITSTSSILSDIDTSSILRADDRADNDSRPQSAADTIVVEETPTDVVNAPIQPDFTATKPATTPCAAPLAADVPAAKQQPAAAAAQPTTPAISEAADSNANQAAAKPIKDKAAETRSSLKPNASHCLVIGSLANLRQAKVFINEQAGSGYNLKVYAADGKYRVYIASGSVEQLLDLKANTPLGEAYPDAWVCKVK